MEAAGGGRSTAKALTGAREQIDRQARTTIHWELGQDRREVFGALPLGK